MTCFTAVFDLLQRSGTEPVISLRSACTLKSRLGNSLEVQGIRVHTSNAGGAGSVPLRGTNIPHARWHGQKKGKKGRLPVPLRIWEGDRRKNRLYHHVAWVCNLLLPLACYLTLTKSMNLSEPQFSHQQNGGNESICLIKSLWELNDENVLMSSKLPDKYKVLNKYQSPWSSSFRHICN